MYIMCMLGAYRGQKRAFDLLEMKLQVVINHHMGAGTLQE